MTDCVATCAASDEVDADGNPAPVWEETSFEAVDTVACGPGWDGDKTRTCGADGVWADVDMDACSEWQCTCVEGDADYDAVTAFRPATGTAACDADKAQCMANGDCLCMESGEWAMTACGADAPGACAADFTGATARACAAGAAETPWMGVWAADADIVSTGCTAVPEESADSTEEVVMVCTCGDDAEDACADDSKDAADEAACDVLGGTWAEKEEEESEESEEASAAAISAVVGLIALLL